MRRTTVLICAVTIALGALAPGSGAGANEDNEPKSQAAKAALRKYEKSIEKAQQAYSREAEAVRKAAAADLAVALKAATRAANLEEANRIKARIDELNEAAGDAARAGKFPRGTWEVTYLNGNRHLYEFDGAGGLRATQPFGKEFELIGKIRREEEDLISSFRPDHIERFNFAGDRLFVEIFVPANQYPGGIAAAIGTGLPTRSERSAK